MARVQRIEYEGAVYHVTAKGNNRRPIFRDDIDRERVLRVLGIGNKACVSAHLCKLSRVAKTGSGSGVAKPGGRDRRGTEGTS